MTITDAGLEHLKGLTRLGDLFLCGTGASNRGIQNLQLVLPDCQIRH
jgi:hypothetical protein